VRLRVLISLLIGSVSGLLCWGFLTRFQQGAGDFNWAIWAARDLLARHNPYDRELQLYPLTCALFGLPFVWMRPEVAGGVFYGLSSALMALGLSRDGYHRLLVFLAYPYWAALISVQWSPLLLASALFPLLLPATLAKPQVGLPVLLTRASRRGLIACALVLAATFIVMPRWPWFWPRWFSEYRRFIPLLVLPGPLLALAAWRYREKNARLLLLMAVLPQRWPYDALCLWLIPETRREIIMTVGFSWVVGIWRWYHAPYSIPQVGRWIVLFIYLPMLALVLFRDALRHRAIRRTARPESTLLRSGKSSDE
jgi:hypothetical protein